MKLTDARRRALYVLVRAEKDRRHVRVSNYTTFRPVEWASSTWCVYWQSADWLVAEHLADRDGDVLTLRSKGRQVAGEAGLS